MHDITQGTIITPNCTVNNAGTGPTPSGNASDGKPILRVTYRIDGTVIGFTEYGLAVAPGSSVTVGMTSNAFGAAGTTYDTSGLAVGAHTISATLDAPNFIIESNETNNVLTQGFNVLASSGSRSGVDQPFDSFSPVNLPVGTGASIDTRMAVGYFNVFGSWNFNNGFGRSVQNPNAPGVYIAQSTSSTLDEGHVSVVGIGVTGAAHNGDRTWIRDYYKFGQSTLANYMWVDMPLTGVGWGEPNGWVHGGNNASGKTNVAGFSNMWGILRTHDITAGIIKHAGAIAIPGNKGTTADRLGTDASGNHNVWPSNSWDIGQSYLGLCPMGSLLYIPTGIAKPGGLTAVGSLVWDQAVTYGWYIYDSTATAQAAYTAEANCYNNAAFTTFKNSADIGTISQQLRRMSNNTQALSEAAHCAGGGSPVASFTGYLPTTITA